MTTLFIFSMDDFVKSGTDRVYDLSTKPLVIRDAETCCAQSLNEMAIST
jgi:hypothetical protein